VPPFRDGGFAIAGGPLRYTLPGCMMCINTTVWINFFDGRPAPHVAALDALIQNDTDLCLCGRIG